jgi:toxin ParE1/3/4
MKVVFAEEALQNLDEILAYTAIHYPTVFGALVVRLKSVIARVAEWPDSAQEVAGRPGVRVVPLIRYPYKVFYRTTEETVEILYIHHAARDER